MILWVGILVGVVVLFIGVVFGFFIVCKYMMSYLKKNLFINE